MIEKLENYCAEYGERVTPPRKAVLEIVAAATKPMSAYDILEALGEKFDKPKPPTAYRALEFLSQHGFIHRIESLNAYVSCSENHKHHGSQFMICKSCGRVDEIHLCHMPDALQKAAKAKGFSASAWNVEISGLCATCG
ncbi:MAG: transcriptional repressor [Micavibrio sp.]|nr:transcriptional repressor [Micavibrio sp.]